MKPAVLALSLLAFSLLASFAATAQAGTPMKKFLQVTLKKSGGGYSVKVPVDQGFAVGGLSPNAFESRFNSMQSIPPLLEFMDQNGYKMTQTITRRGWGFVFTPASQTLMLFEKK